MWSSVSLSKSGRDARAKRSTEAHNRPSGLNRKPPRRRSSRDEVGELIHALTLEGLAVAGLIHEQAKKIKAQRVNQRTRASINELIELDKAIAKCLEEVNQKERLLFDKLRLIIPLIEGRKRH